MKILLIHADYIKFKPQKKAITRAEEAEKKETKVKECLVVFSAVEERDEANIDQIAKNCAREVEDVARQVKAKNIVLYPWVHLTNKPSNPETALKVLKNTEKILKRHFYVTRSSFGWYKSFNLACKGHPLAELSKEITAEKLEKAVEKEKKLKSEWFILTPEGKLNKIELKDNKVIGFDFSKNKKLELLALYEMKKVKVMEQEPPHVKLMRKLGIADYEPASDPGNLRWPAKGKLIKSLIEEFVTRKMLDYGAMEVETPIMYDYEHPALKSYLSRFPARQYTIQTPNKRVFLRFSACFGQFLLAKDMNISYRNLPLKLYELTRYSFRVEQRGELVGLRRLRTFTMPDCHAFCKDFKQAKEEMLKRFKLAKEVQGGLGLTHNDFEFAIRIVKDFYAANKDFVKKLVKLWGKPVLIELWDKRFFYFVLKYEWNFIDNLNKASCLATDQIDIENAARYELQYTDKDNKRKYPLILHLSPCGAIERVIYALLEKAWMLDIKHACLPLWLSPTQIRLCPVSDKFLRLTAQIAGKIESEQIRVDIDDRVESVEKKIHDAEVEWIPIIIVIGEKELKTGKLATRFRETGKVEKLTVKKVIKFVRKKTKGMPFKPLPLPKLLTKRPVFIG